ncbi:hypothetical protein EZS27_020623 [termite gut metagenome]|uniref:Uncharacterized protein n=1 Tax=termite gut metagenome TaxID=433724 RepID=A0A5J4RAD0_9ZZZZ
MVTPIRSCPTLRGKVAEEFVKKADEAYKEVKLISVKM